MADRPTQVFLSYAHADRVHLDAFRTHFGPVERGQNLTVWFDTKLRGGQVWDNEIRRALNGSDIFVCLVTANFLNSNYIRDTELPAIWQAVRGRGALLLTVIVEECFWKNEFNAVECLPKDKNGNLKPAADWRPKRNGFHASAEQAARAIEEWLSLIPPPPPDPGPGLSLQVTEAGFDLSPDAPGPSERSDPLQAQLLAGLRQRWEQLLADAAKSCLNTHPTLYRNLEQYGRLLSEELAELDVVSLVAEGSALGGMVEALRAPPSGSMTEPLEPELAAGFESLLREHARLITGFAEGREIIARDRLLERMIDQPEEAGETLHSVLEPMIEQKGLLTLRAAAVLRAIDDGLIETGVQSTDALMDALRQGGRAISFITRAVSSKMSLGDAATLATLGAVLAGDPNLETYKAAFQFLREYAPQISAFASNQPELRRIVDWTMEQIGIRGTSRVSQIGLDDSTDENQIHWLGRDDITSIEAAARRKSLVRLDCSRTNIRDVSPLSGHPNIKYIDISGTMVTDVSPLSSCKKLKYIYAADLNASLSDFSCLENLDLEELVLLGSNIGYFPEKRLAKFQINPDGFYMSAGGTPSGWFRYYLTRR